MAVDLSAYSAFLRAGVCVIFVPFAVACTELQVTGDSCRLSRTADTSSDIYILSAAACRGDRQAMLALAKALESGDGIPADLAQAARFYEFLSANQIKPNTVWQPGAGDVPGTLIRTGPSEEIPALPEAQYRLAKMYLEGRGVKTNREKAARYLRMAANAGYRAAIELIAKKELVQAPITQPKVKQSPATQPAQQ